MAAAAGSAALLLPAASKDHHFGPLVVSSSADVLLPTAPAFATEEGVVRLPALGRGVLARAEAERDDEREQQHRHARRGAGDGGVRSMVRSARRTGRAPADGRVILLAGDRNAHVARGSHGEAQPTLSGRRLLPMHLYRRAYGHALAPPLSVPLLGA